MSMRTVGEKLRQARVRKGSEVSDIESLTGIDSRLILIMELDQFELLPSEQVHYYITTFSESVGLDSRELLSQYETSKNQKPRLKSDDSYESMISESNLFIGAKRQTRKLRPKRNNRIPQLALLAVSLLVIIVAGYLLYPMIPKWNTPKKENTFASIEQSNIKKDDNNQEIPVKTTEKPKAEITVVNSGDYITATVKTGQFPVTVDFSLDGADSSWVALTNSNLGEAGILLNQTTSTYRTELWEGVTDALVTLGFSKGISVKVNDVPIDLSQLGTVSPAYIQLVVENSEQVNNQ